MNLPARHYVPSLRRKPDDICYCGSGKRFGDCCGNPAENRPYPVQLNVIHNFVTPAERKQLLRFAQKQERKWLMMVDKERSTPEKNVQIRDPGRVTQAVNMGKRESVMQAWVREALKEQVGTRYGSPVQRFEPPYILRYPPGGKYVLHCDGEQFDEHAQRWYRIRDRDVSLLIYLNDDYEGGELQFDVLNFTYKPQAGDLVFFPSNHLFSHQSMPIISGYKWAIVSWSCLAHTPRVTAHMKNWKTLPV
ncbi:MAG: 2OG-Fe(II) oxygenase [Pseudomonadota bacterium]